MIAEQVVSSITVERDGEPVEVAVWGDWYPGCMLYKPQLVFGGACPDILTDEEVKDAEEELFFKATR